MIDKNEFFRQAALHICSNLEIETAMFSCFEVLQQVMPVDRIHLELYKPEMRAVQIIASVTSSESKKEDTLIYVPKEFDELAEQAVQHRKGHVIIYDEEYSKWEPIITYITQFIDFTPTSIMDLALKYKGEYSGGLTLFSEGKERFTQEHASRLGLLQKPFEISLANYFTHREVVNLKDMLADDNRYLQQELHRLTGDEIVGAHFGLKHVMEMVRHVAVLDSPVLLLGETGTGKDVIANAIHDLSPRRENPFIAVNCGAIPENLLDSELFGHEKGAFTGALSQKRGRFERANKGTIFLDEIGELPPQAQVRFLRVLQQKEIERVGGTKTISVDIRVIAATNRNLEEMVKGGNFREDLWFRINVFPLWIPPLRERTADIPALIQHFIRLKTKELKLPAIPTVASGALDILMEYHWPGNVRELQNIVERALILHPKGPLTFEHLNLTPQQAASDDVEALTIPDTLDDAIAWHIRRILKKTDGKVHGPDGAATVLGVNPSTLRHRMKKLGITYGKKKRE
ncbi:MAG: AAA domain-containing protein [bacterium]|nr:AAA domain-containing protein [bacterium]